MVIRLRNREDAGAARTTPQKNREMIDSSFKLSTVMIHCRESRRSGSLSSISVGRLEWIMNMKKRSGAKALRTRDGSALAKDLGERVISVLHIDDDPNDTELLRAAVRKAKAPFVLHNVEDGENAIAYLSGQGIYADRQRYQVPALILLDLKMPRATGFEVLSWIRAHPELGELPVVVLSGSERQDDIRRAYAHGANSYHIKPLGFAALVTLVKGLDQAWAGTGPRAAA